MARSSIIASLLVSLVLVGCASCGKVEKPEEGMAPSDDPASRPARTLPVPGAEIASPPSGSGTGKSGMTWEVPSGWVEEAPSSSMRRAQYRVSGPGGDGECVVFYFGPGQGGDPESNAVRWAGQFKQPDGKTPEDALKTSKMKVGDIGILEVEVTGTYSGGMAPTMAPAEEKPGYMLLGAIAQGLDANWFFKLTGPEATVQAQRAAFEGMLRTLKTGA